MIWTEERDGKKVLMTSKMYNEIEMREAIQKAVYKYQETVDREREINRKLKREISAIRKKCGVMEQMYNQLFKTYNGRKAILELIEKEK